MINELSVAEYLSPEMIESLARPSDIRYGRAIYERGGVELLDGVTAHVEAWVGGLDGSVAEGGSQRQRTRLSATATGLAWHCAGNLKNHQVFCKHCVALALKILELTTVPAAVARCPWAGVSPAMQTYHDTEWGVPVMDDHRLFEFIVLESAQAGLSWSTILNRRTGYRSAFAGFDPDAVAAFDDTDIARLLGDVGIIRNRLKISATIRNANVFQSIRHEFGSFYNYQLTFVPDAPIRNAWTEPAQVPVTTATAEQLSADLRRRGFRFFGPTIAYAHMQACGLVNDHLVSCFRYKEILQTGEHAGKK